MPSPSPKDFLARMDELEPEIERLSATLRDDDASISGAALSNTSHLLINYVSPKHLTKLWRSPSYPSEIMKSFSDLDNCIEDYLEDLEDKPNKEILSWKAYFRSSHVYSAFSSFIETCLVHHPDNFCHKPRFWAVLNCVHRDSTYMNWSCREVLVTPNMPHLTVLSIQPQQGPPNKLTLTEFWSLVHWAIRLSSRIPNTSYMPVRLISICHTQARIVSANFSLEYLRFAYRSKIPREGRHVCCDVSVEDYQDLRDKQKLLYLMDRIAELPVKIASG